MNDWTPCSKRLPDKEGEYIVTDDAGGMATVTTDEFEHCTNGEPMWLFGQHITAWMPFPEPYKEEKMKPKNMYISIDSYTIEEDNFLGGDKNIVFSIGKRTYRIPLYLDADKNPHILDLEAHDRANKLTVDDNPIPDGLDPIRIIVNGPATIVFWEDGTKTVVKCIDGEPWDIYHAFTAALAKKVYGNNSRIHKILKTKVEYQEDSNG